MPYSMWTLFTAAIGNFENETYLDPDAPPTSVFFFIVYTFVISIILFNLLITLLTDAYSQVSLALATPLGMLTFLSVRLPRTVLRYKCTI
jgi:hypothetical protein